MHVLDVCGCSLLRIIAELEERAVCALPRVYVHAITVGVGGGGVGWRWGGVGVIN